MDRNENVIKTLIKLKNSFKIDGVYSGGQIHGYIDLIIKAIES